MGIGAAITTLATTLASKLTVAAIAEFAISTAISMAVSSLFGSKPKQRLPDNQAVDPGLQTVIRGSVEAHRIIYGRARVGGVMGFTATTGGENEYLHMVVLIAAHEIDEVETIWLDDTELPELDENGWVREGSYSGSVQIEIHKGASDQLADQTLVNEVEEWTAAHRLRGLAYARIKLIYNRSIFPSGIPTPRFLVRGKAVYDPRIDQTVWSDNWALCIYDYARSEYGIKALENEFNESNIIAQANICDEMVSKSSGETQPRYTLDGVIKSDERPNDVLDEMMIAAAGLMSWNQGAYYLRAGGYEAPSVSLDDHDFIGRFTATPHMPDDQIYNRVTGTFINPDNFWQESDIPAQENTLFVEQDGGEEKSKDIKHRFIADHFRAQRINRIFLNRSRLGLTLNVKANLRALKLGVGKSVAISLKKAGFENKVFLVENFKEADDGIELILREDAPDVYDWNYGQALSYDPAPNTNLPNPFLVTVVGGFSLDSVLVGTQSGDHVFNIVASWDLHTDAFVSRGGWYEIEYKESTADIYASAARVDGGITEQKLSALKPDIFYDLRITAYNARGVQSQPAEIFDFLVGQTVTTNSEDWENENLAAIDFETSGAAAEDWETI